MKDGRRDEIATEARDIVRRAVGDAAGLTIKAQLRQAARNLGYVGDAWRLREALYRRAGAWCSAALEDLRRRFAAWRQKERTRVAPAALYQRMTAMRDGLAELQRRFGDLEIEVGRALQDHEGLLVRSDDE